MTRLETGWSFSFIFLLHTKLLLICPPMYLSSELSLLNRAANCKFLLANASHCRVITVQEGWGQVGLEEDSTEEGLSINDFKKKDCCLLISELKHTYSLHRSSRFRLLLSRCTKKIVTFPLSQTTKNNNNMTHKPPHSKKTPCQFIISGPFIKQ